MMRNEKILIGSDDDYYYDDDDDDDAGGGGGGDGDGDGDGDDGDDGDGETHATWLNKSNQHAEYCDCFNDVCLPWLLWDLSYA